jgi:negative regulator of flagellin synthesis FlgM
MNTIDRFSAQNISRTYVHTTDARQERSHPQREETPKVDSVTLSDDAKSLAAAQHAVQAAPDVRDQKVEAIKQRVQDGTYSVPSRVLARKILSEQADSQ